MNKQNNNPVDAANLRQKAEMHLNQRKSEPNKFTSETDMMRLIHELEVHQVELELQNEELILANNMAREATEKFEELYDFAPSGYFTLSRQGKILEMNLRSAQILGKERNLLINSQFGLFIKEDSRTVFSNFLEKIFQGNSHVNCEVPLLSINNNNLHVHLTGIMSDKKEQCRITAIDITEQKNNEKELLISKENSERNEIELNKVQEITHVGSWHLNLETNEVAWTEELYKMYGFDPALPPPPYTEHKKLFTTESWKILSASLAKTSETGIPYELELKTIRKDRSNGWMWVRGEAIFDNSNKIIGLWGAAQDITERKHNEEQLRHAKENAEKSEENLSITLHSIGDGVITTDKFGMIDRMNPVALKLCGWHEDEIKGKKLTEVFNIIDAYTREPVHNPVEKVIENGEIVGLANHTVLVAKDGKEYQIADSAAPIKDNDGNIKGVVLVFSDVSEKYAAEEQIRFQAHITANSPVITAYHDNELNMIWANKAYENATGLSMQEIKGRKCYQVWNLSKPCNGCPVIKAIETGENAVHELTPQNQDHWPESQGYWLSQATPVRDAQGVIIGAIEFAIDITERKHAELLLQEKTEEIATQNEELNVANQELIVAKEKAEESDEKYRALFDNAPLSYQSLDENGCVIDVNPKWLKTLGFERSEVIGKWFGDFLHPDFAKRFRISFPAFKERGYISDVQYKLRRKDNTYIDVSFEGYIGKTPEGKFKQTYCVFKDVTEQIVLENALRENEERLRLALKATNDVVWDWDIVNDSQCWNEAGKIVFGWTEIVENRVNAAWWLERIHPDDRKRVEVGFYEAVQKQTVFHWQDEYRFRKSDGTYAEVIDRANVLRDNTGKPLRMIGAMLDITERKKASFEAQRYADEQILMAKIAHELVGMESKEQMYHYIAEQVYNLCSESYLILGYYDEEKDALMLKSTFGLKKQIEGLKKFFVINPYKMSINLKDFPEEELKMIKNRKLNFFKKDGIHKISGGLLSKKLGKMVEEFLGVKNTYLMGISWNEKNYGVIGIISRSKLPLKNMVLIETIVNQSAIAVQRLFTSEELKRSESRYRTLVEMSPDGIGLFKPEGKLLSCNLQMARLLGYSDEADLLSREFNASDLITEDDRKRVSQNLKLLLKGKSVPLQTYTLRRKDGSVFPAELNSVTVRDEVGNSLRLLSIVRDVTDRIKGEEALARYNEQLRNFAGHNETVREQERLNLARDIHDVLGSSLAGLKMELVILKRLLSDDLLKSKPDIPKQINSMSIQINESVEVMRKIVRELRPGILDELGLVEAIKWYAGEIANRGNIFCKIKIAGKLINFDKTQSVMIFRIYQEIMTNIVLHSKATKVTIQIDLNDNILQLSVNDNGIGINEDAAARTDSFGLIGMKERALLMDGKLSIHGSRNKGTTVMLEVPVNI